MLEAAAGQLELTEPLQREAVGGAVLGDERHAAAHDLANGGRGLDREDDVVAAVLDARARQELVVGDGHGPAVEEHAIAPGEHAQERVELGDGQGGARPRTEELIGAQVDLLGADRRGLGGARQQRRQRRRERRLLAVAHDGARDAEPALGARQPVDDASPDARRGPRRRSSRGRPVGARGLGGRRRRVAAERSRRPRRARRG